MWLTRAWLLLAALLVLSIFPTPAQADCGCGAECLCGPGCQCAPPEPPPVDPNANTVRRNQAHLTDKERQEFVDAVRQLQQTYRPGADVTIYDEYVHMHIMAMMDSNIHNGPVFFPWHRLYLRYFELELQAINPKVTIPYWDFTVDNKQTSSIWSKDFMGGNGDTKDYYTVKSGPFRQGVWAPAFEGPDLRRNFGGFFNLTLPTPDDLAQAFRIKRYDARPYNMDSDIRYSFRNYMTGWNHPSGDAEMHNRVHEWVGGTMMGMASPNDPVFWMLHAFLDKCWAEWMDIHGPDYPKFGAEFGHNLYDPMYLFGATPRSVLRHARLGYSYK